MYTVSRPMQDQKTLRSLSLAATLFLGAAAGQTSPPEGPFTAAQSTAGRAAYQANCASCHLPELSGRNEASQLAGSNFMTAWGARTTSQLLAYISSTMPPGSAGGLSGETYLSLVAFLLEANGAKAGTHPLTAQTAAPIRSVATGEMPAPLRQALRQGSETSAAQQATRPKGLTVKGEVKNYVPVTE